MILSIEEEIDAKLMSAAPDLLAVLKELIPDIEAVNRSNGNQIGHGRYLDAIAVIAKAEGK